MTYPIPGIDPNPELTRMSQRYAEQDARAAARVPAEPQTPVKQNSPAGVDPKGAEGAAKLPLGALPWAVVLEASCGLGEGMIKYGAHNWRTSGGVQSMTYTEAAMRHLTAFILGEDIDPASGLPHITKAISSLMVLRDAQMNGTAIDNRPPPVPAELLQQLQDSWARVRPLAAAAAKELQK